MTARHPYYGVEVVRLRDLDDFRPCSLDPARIYLVPIGDGMELGFFVRLKGTETLRACLAGAKSPSNPDGHVFPMVALSEEWGDSAVLFSDPTLTLRPTNRLSWYLGTPGVDPHDAMERIIRRVAASERTKRLFVTGASGGGFASMRLAARFEHAVALAVNPQTDVFRYARGPLALTLQAAWPGWTRDRILEEHPERFRLADVYNDQSLARANLVHCVQNTGDRAHVETHLKPFLHEVGAPSESFSALQGRMTISRPFHGIGHIGMPREYWLAEAKFAAQRCESMRPGGLCEESPAPTTGAGTTSTPARQHNLRFAATLTW